MCTTDVNAMPDSTNEDDAVKVTGQLAGGDDDYFKMAHPMQVVPPSLYVEEEKRLAGLESNDNEDESCASKKKKKKKKKHRKNVPLEGILDDLNSKKHKKHNDNVNGLKAEGTEGAASSHKHSTKRKRNDDEANGQANDNANSSAHPPPKPKKQKRQNGSPNGHVTHDVDSKDFEKHTVHKDNTKPKKRKKQNGGLTDLVEEDIDIKDFEEHKVQKDNIKPKKQKKQNEIVKEQVADDVDSKDFDQHDVLLKDDAQGVHQSKNQKGDGGVYREGMSLAEAVQAKHEAKKKSKTNKWRKNRPIEKGVTRRKTRLEEKLKQLKAKCEILQARKNMGQSVMRQEKRLMSKERKLSSELGVISGSKKERKRKLLERRMTLAEGLRSPHAPAAILNKEGNPVKSKFDFSIFSVGDDKSRSSNLHGRDYKRLLETVEKRQEEVDELKRKDMEKGRKLEEKMAWQTMMSRARGEKVKDDPKMLKKAMKNAEKMKVKRKKKWEERTAKVEEAKEMRQRKRQANLDKRKSDKMEKKKKKAIKKGRYIPGFG